jgi:tetratricopeptide (TPR) repeat protein
MSEPLYERYKDALRRGHVAALRDRLDEAFDAYQEAAAIAPERALPHVSQGGVLLRLGRAEDALRAYTAGLERSPRDPGGLAGRAEALSTLGRRADAAEALDELAALQEQEGRLAEACDTARRALELAESRARREQIQRLAAALRSGPLDEAAAAALDKALGVLDLEPSVPGHSAPDVHEIPVPDVPPPTPQIPPEPVPPPDRGTDLTAEAETMVIAGDAGAPERCLSAAAAHRAGGRLDAAIDACYLGLSISPGHPALHLVLAELYVERGWRGPAAEKLLLLGRLVELDGDTSVRDRLCALVGATFADDPRLTALCP